MVRLRRALAGMAVAFTPIAAIVAPGLASTAEATTPEVGFTADPLPTYQTNGIAWALAQAEGVVYVGGTFSAVRPPGSAAGVNESAASNFVALDATTGTPTGCQLAFTGPSSSVRALAVSPDQQTLYAAGLFSAVGGTPAQNFAAIDLTTCRPILSFRPQVGGWARSISVAPNGNVFIGGDFGTVNDQPRQRFAAFDPTGALLPWAPAAASNPKTDAATGVTTIPPSSGYAIAITPDGQSAAIGGAFDTINGADSHALAIVDTASGAVVRGYPNRSFASQASTVKTLFADSTGLYSGNEGTGFEVFDGRTALDLGTFNQRWRDWCFGATQSVLVERGNLYGASHAHDCNRMGGFPNGRRQHLTVQSLADPRLKVWWPDTNDGIGEGIGPRALTVAPGGTHRYLWAAGEFTSVNGVAQQGLMRLADAPDSGAPPAPYGMTASTAVAGQIRLRWLASTDRDDETLTYKVYRNNSTTPVATLTANSDWWRRPQVSYLDTNVVPGTLYVYKVTATDSSGNVSSGPTLGVRPSSTSSAYAATVQADNPSLYWRYNEAAGLGNLADESPAGNAAILVGTRTPAITPAALSQDTSTGMGFDGSTGYAYEAQPEQAPGTYTIETWFQTTSVNGGKLVGFGNNTTRLSVTNYDRHIFMGKDGRLVFGASSKTSTLVTPAAYNDGQWHHVVATQGASGMALYVDGRAVATNALTTNSAYQGYWRVGGDALSGWVPAGTSTNPVTSNFFKGQLDETAVYRSALSADAVAAHYRASGRTVAADTTAPTVPTGLTSTVSGSNVTLKWTASTDNVGVTGYTVHRSSTSGFTPSTTTKVADTTSTTGYTDTARPQGTWYYRVVARDAAGNTSAASAQVSAAIGVTTDTTAPTAPAGLTATTTGSSVALKWTASTDNVGVTGYTVHRSSTSGFTPSATTKLADTTTTSYTDATAPAGTWFYRVTARDAAANTSAASAQASAVVAAPADTQPPTAPTAVTAAASGSSVGVSWTASTDNVGVTGYTVHRSSTGGFTPSATTKLADVTGTSYTDATAPAGTWFYRVTARDAAGNTSAPSAEASATVAGLADTDAPTAPTAVTAAASGSSVGVSWTASTDNVAVTGYTVHRSSTSGFTPSATTKLADVTSTSYTDPAVPAGTWFYRVIAVDAAGNTSAPSAQASATVAAPAGTVTHTLTPSADACVQSSSAATNYGTSSSLCSTGTGVVSYLRFPLPAKPAGTVLKSASLRILTTTIASAGSVDGHLVNLGPSGWTETTLTWNNRPAAPSPATLVGTITGASAPSTQVTTAIDPAALEPFAGSDLNLTVRDSGTDSLWFWSKEASASQRPQLTLVYGAP